ncbi:MAG: sporulation protein YqfD [Lachnospiraceae bacterium]|nr:sporulation protein YqfD [Lachnospiraceae bacterium]
MTALLRYLSGYVRVELTGYATERFFNLCTNHNIYIWDLDHREDTYEFSMKLKDFFTIRPFVKKTKTSIHVVKKCGFPFLLYRYRKRKLFLFGFLLGISIVYGFSCYVWNIQICGNSALSEDTIYRYLEEEKIHVGTAKREVDCEKLESLIRQHFSNVIWTSVRLEGTKLTVDVKENLITAEPDEKEEEEESAKDIVSDKKATILQIITRSGTPQVKAGDKVKKGAILVSGRIDILNDAKEVVDYRYCKADADILARTSYPYETRVSKKAQKKVYTGKEKVHYSFWYHRKYIGFSGRKISYRLYEKETEKVQLRIFKNFYLPFYLQKDTYKEYQLKEYEVKKAEAKAEAAKDLDLFLSKLEEKGLQITEKNVMMSTEKNDYVFQGTILTEEKFGVYQDTEVLEVPKEEGIAENESE